jgi:hypothetical protein
MTHKESISGFRGTGSCNCMTLTSKINAETIEYYDVVKFGVDIFDGCQDNRGHSLNFDPIF